MIIMVIKNKVGLNGKLNFLGKDKLQNNKFEIFYKKLDILFNDSKFELTAFKDNFPIQNNKEFEELAFIFLTRNYVAFKEFMFYSYEEWQSYDCSLWINILKRLSLNSFKLAAAIESYFDFFYMYLEIDLIQEFSEINDTDEEIKYLILKSYYKYPGRLYVDFDDYYHKNAFDKFKVSRTNFKIVQSLLISQGFKVAEPIISRNKIELNSLTIVMAKRPKSWEWAKNFGNL